MHAHHARLAAGMLLSTSLVVTTAVTASAVAPAAGAGPDVPPEAATSASAPEMEPVVIALTDDDGDRTQVATAGLEVAVPTGRFSASSGTATVSTDAVLTRPIPTEEFLVAGLTWEAGQELAADAQVFVRVEEDGVWSEWEETSHEEGTSGAEAAAGTDPFVTGGAQTIQVRITGSASALPDNLAITVLPADDLQTPAVPPTAAGAEPESAPIPVPTVAPAAPGSSAVIPAGLVGASVAASPVATAVLPPRPAITSRAGWRADESKMTWRPTYRALRAAVVHHTAGTNSYTQAQAASVVRGIYQYHAVTRGWGDIGYNFLVDKWGRVYEGRTGSLAAPAGMMTQGAHAAPVNNGTVGISAMGDYTKVAVPTAVIDAMTNVLAWQFGRAGINATTTSGIISPGTPALARGVNLPRIFGHMDVSSTACPGKDIYGRLATMRTAVARKTNPPAPAPAPAAPAPVKTSAPASPTKLRPVYLNNALTSSSDVVFSYGPTSSTIIAGDWNGDRRSTVAARTSSTYAMRNTNSTGPADFTTRYGRSTDQVLVGDWNGDGKETLGVRRGTTIYLRNGVTGGNADIVFRYGRSTDQVLVGDWNGDGKDTLAFRRGRTYYVINSNRSGAPKITLTYGREADQAFAGDWNGDGKDTLAVRRGDRIMLRNTLTSGASHKTFTYGRTTDKMLVGDWNGDRRDTFGIFR